MCGLGGIVNSPTVIYKEQASEIARCVSYRGPDCTQIRLFDPSLEPSDVSGTTAFFFNRLAIMDPDSRSNQPFQDDDCVLLFNGEIYNFKVLREDLKKRGVTFRTSSDTEVLFYALKLWGTEAIAKLNGMFAFFFLDRKKRSFILARDRVGIKPLYYKVQENSLIFASELHSVLRLSNKSHDISARAIDYYLTLQYIPTPHTIFSNIYKLQPGHFIAGAISDLKTTETPRPRQYFDLYSSVSDAEYKSDDNQLERLLVDSIALQLEADVPLGLFLSSGLDSSLLAALVNKHFRDRPFSFFTVAFDEKTASDESADALKYLKGFRNPNLHHHTLPLNSPSISERLPRLYDYFDEPFGDPAALLNWAISEKARQHVTVVLSGDGADELFWGYDRYTQWRMESGRAYKTIRGLSAITPLIARAPESRVKYTLLNMLERDPFRIYLNILTPRLFGFIPSLSKDNSLWFLRGLEPLLNRKDLPSIIDLKTYLPDAMLYKVDRASMAASLEARVPYLDNNVVNYAVGLPLGFKSTSQLINKAPLKSLLRSLAPHYNINKPKKGFSFPLRQWLQTEWKTMVMDLTTKQDLENLGLPSHPFLDIVNKFYNRQVPCTMEVWYLFNLLLWHNHFKSHVKMPFK